MSSVNEQTSSLTTPWDTDTKWEARQEEQPFTFRTELEA